ncbi:hypothetical protein BDR26DRAFT_1010545 [Obelidium mucronatum]|nr:hypothetical protein BDR26DRAFT_1010545 [Obelidium mucronatum]
MASIYAKPDLAAVPTPVFAAPDAKKQHKGFNKVPTLYNFFTAATDEKGNKLYGPEDVIRRRDIIFDQRHETNPQITERDTPQKIRDIRIKQKNLSGGVNTTAPKPSLDAGVFVRAFGCKTIGPQAGSQIYVSSVLPDISEHNGSGERGPIASNIKTFTITGVSGPGRLITSSKKGAAAHVMAARTDGFFVASNSSPKEAEISDDDFKKNVVRARNMANGIEQEYATKLAVYFGVRGAAVQNYNEELRFHYTTTKVNQSLGNGKTMLTNPLQDAQRIVLHDFHQTIAARFNAELAAHNANVAAGIPDPDHKARMAEICEICELGQDAITNTGDFASLLSLNLDTKAGSAGLPTAADRVPLLASFDADMRSSNAYQLAAKNAFTAETNAVLDQMTAARVPNIQTLQRMHDVHALPAGVIAREDVQFTMALSFKSAGSTTVETATSKKEADIKKANSYSTTVDKSTVEYQEL